MSNQPPDEPEAPAPAGWRVTRGLKRLRSFLRSAVKDADTAPEVGSPQQPEQAVAPPEQQQSLAKKVGVLTLTLHTNYGGNLQAFALMTVLRRLGHDPVLINRKHAGPPNAGDAAGRRKAPAIVPVYAPGKRGPSYAFIDQHVAPFTRPFRSTAELEENIGRYDLDAIVVGSDQVWRAKYTKALLPNYFLDFLPEHDAKIRRISYAASFGADTWEFAPAQERMAKQLIGRFDAVSVREDSAVDFCARHLGVAARQVLDPTLLLQPEDYLSLILAEDRKLPGGALFAYVLDRSIDKVRLVAALAKRLGVEASAVDGRPFATADDTGEAASVGRWLAAVHDAAFVATDSFHGVAFAILFNKPFIAYGNPVRGLARFTSLLRLFGLEDRLVVKSRDADLAALLRPIDWLVVNARLAELRAESLEFLRSALAMDRPERAPPALSTPALVAAAPAAAPVRQAATRDQSNPLGVLCSGCGACVSESQGSLRMAWDEDGFLVPRATAGAVPAGAVRVCPFNPAPEPAVRDEDALATLFLSGAPRFDLGAGRFENAYVGYSRAFRATSSSGGVATYVCEQLLRRGDVDSLFVVRSDGGSGYRYQVFDDADRIAETSKTRYYPVTMEELFAVIDRTPGRIAVSGVACFIKAIRLKQFYHPELRDRIPFLVGIICGGLKSRGYTEFLAQSAGIAGEFTAPDYRVKNPQGSAMDYAFAATDARSRTRSVRMRRLGDMWGTGLFKARACDFCTDVLTELADISLGDAWLPEYKADGMGNSVIVTRTPLAEAIVRAGIERGELAVEAIPIARVIQSQAGGFSHKQNAVSFRVAVAQRFTDTPVPVIRARLLKPVPVSQALVQLHRERARSKSLRFWRETGRAPAFLRRMHATLELLKAATAARRDTTGNTVAGLVASGRLDRVRAVAATPGEDRLTARWLLDALRRRRTDVATLTDPRVRSDAADGSQSVDTLRPPG